MLQGNGEQKRLFGGRRRRRVVVQFSESVRAVGPGGRGALLATMAAGARRRRGGLLQAVQSAQPAAQTSAARALQILAARRPLPPGRHPRVPRTRLGGAHLEGACWFDRDDAFSHSYENGQVVCYPYEKFFNLDEPLGKRADPLDVGSMRVYEKLDGSLATLYHYQNQWHVASSGTPDGDGDLTQTQTFAELFWDIWKKEGYHLPKDTS